ncbi:HIT domain-containing protein [Patescibacteria group bacterium]|nr:HIT domain-containing protein [Patescibacteria group bacterium]
MKTECAFCDRTQFEERLIAETNEHYVIATLGQITGGYVLIIPKEHISCFGAFANSQAESMWVMVRMVFQALSMEYLRNTGTPSFCPITMFEHGIVGQSVKHAHLHILPAAVDLTPKIRADFPTAKIEELQWGELFLVLYRKHPQPYLFWVTPSNGPTVCWNPPAPLQYLRTVAAELLGRPERANWRNMNPELDKRLWQETVRRLKPYFQSIRPRW